MIGGRSALWRPSAAGGTSWSSWRRSGPSTRPGPCRVTRWRRPPAWPCFPSWKTPRYKDLADVGGPSRRRAGGRRRRRPGWSRPGPGGRTAGRRSSSGPAPSPTTRAPGHRRPPGLYPAVMHGLLERGVAIAPGPYEVLFPSLAHSDTDLERTVEAFGEACPPGSSPL